MHLVRGSSLTGFAPLVSTHGGDPDALLASAGIDPADAGNDDRFIPLRSAIAAVEDAATVLDVPDLGLQLAQHQSIDILGPVALAARTTATVAEAFTILDTYMSSHSPGIIARITDHADPALRRFEYDFLLQPSPPQSQAIELALGLTLQVLRLFLGAAYRPVAVHVPHPLAHRLLVGTDLPVSHVSRQLGYAEHSVFTRACKRWFGVTPTAYRNRYHPGGGRLAFCMG
ncbi:AraC family transcriptional regulator ligand-binding domain-containing protein [Mycobacteroides chelonae]|uniref:AraC family transcriptional regulator ligand-binding domain-containing protein n=1 Tax=Mycobacteroides chelonae TaxID=1774 RepID=UPI000991BE00|nr:AraC family transcriptional regulator ligand-binding domain-containing protein [Mycobacteroides chelonae]